MSFYGQIDFLNSLGVVGETALFLNRESYLKEIMDCQYCGRPISYRQLTPYEFWFFIKNRNSLWF